MVEARIYFERAAARRGGDQGPWFILSGLSCQCDCRYRGFFDERHAARRLAQRRRLFRWKLRCRERIDFVVSSPCSERQMGNGGELTNQRVQPWQDRQVGGGIE